MSPTPEVHVDPSILDEVDIESYKESLPSAVYTEFDPCDFLHYLPDREAEIFWLIFVKGKTQEHVGKLIGMEQSSIHYRYWRCVEKIGYLMVLTVLDVGELIRSIDFLAPHEHAVLVDLFFFLNLKAVAKKHGDMPYSSVRWIVLKTRQNLEKKEREDPERWGNVLGLIYLLQRSLGIRLRSE